MYDMIIVGAGPAGATLARGLGQRYRVLLVDKRNFDSEARREHHEKSCGGLLDPSAQKALTRLNLALPKSVLASPQVFAIRAIDLDNKMERYYQKQYVNVDRGEFDRWLVQKAIAQRGVTLMEEASVVGFREDPHFIQVKIKQNGKVQYANARYLVGADGAASMVRPS